MDDNKPLVGLQSTLPFDKVLYKVLAFHFPEGISILDPTPGEKHSWRYYLQETRKPSFFPLKKWTIHFVQDDILSFQKTKALIDKVGPVEGIFFDPPYIFGLKSSSHDRQKDYGGYHHTFDAVRQFMSTANQCLPEFLHKHGLLFLKYTDVFSMEDRKFHFCTHEWTKEFSNFVPYDHYIIRHSHASPTAWLVKNRPCGIANYTYLTVFCLKETFQMLHRFDGRGILYD